MDISPLSLGTAVEGGRMDVLIKRNTAIPTSVTEEYTTARDNQAVFNIPIFEGERKQAMKK